jgi:hypothetical protein
MEQLCSIFTLFGGIRPMARALGESPSKVMAWKRAGHIPAQTQAKVLEKGLAQGLPLTAEHVVFPLGRPAPDVANGGGCRRLRSARQSATREGGGMTKLRTPLSFSRAITTIAAAIGWEAAAKVTGRSVRTVRHWSESDRHGTPTLDQALALDRAFIAAGGDHGPILSSYGLQLDVALVDAVACRTALAEDIAATTRETGDAISHCIQALHPGATPAQIYRAIAETEEADALFPRLLGRLKALLPGTGAGREATGEMR